MPSFETRPTLSDGTARCTNWLTPSGHMGWVHSHQCQRPASPDYSDQFCRICGSAKARAQAALDRRAALRQTHLQYANAIQQQAQLLTARLRARNLLGAYDEVRPEVRRDGSQYHWTGSLTIGGAALASLLDMLDLAEASRDAFRAELEPVAPK